ncbi:hypothetical protein FRC00_003481 [Tulasnella sp. 408]|nr:hypothetical protein FRC00_003481 [Tulasnella sp. 408]
MSSYWERLVQARLSKELFIGVALGFSLCLSSTSLWLYFERDRQKSRPHVDFDNFTPIEIVRNEVAQGVPGLVGRCRVALLSTSGLTGDQYTGNTPLVRINSLSDALGVEILGKAEFLNPGGSVKDRVALKIIEEAEEQGLLHPHSGSTIFEGTVGSTGISIATIGRAKGYETTIIMPDDVAEEKSKALEALGAKVEKVRPSSIVDKKQFVNVARQRALEFGNTKIADDQDEGVAVSSTASSEEVDDIKARAGMATKARGFFADQFENRSNYDAHFKGTGPEIYRQTNGELDAFVSGAGKFLSVSAASGKTIAQGTFWQGTGGTIAGTGAYLKSIKPSIKVDTVVEGIGINRLTHNFELALPIIDDAYAVTDAEAVSMSRYLVKHDGLFLGSSSACNLVTCVRLAKKLGRGKTIVTILCDSGTRHYSKFWNDEYLRKADIPVDISIVEKLLVQDN